MKQDKTCKVQGNPLFQATYNNRKQLNQLILCPFDTVTHSLHFDTVTIKRTQDKLVLTVFCCIVVCSLKKRLSLKFARFVLFRLIKKCFFNLLCVLDQISSWHINMRTSFWLLQHTDFMLTQLHRLHFDIVKHRLHFDTVRQRLHLDGINTQTSFWHTSTQTSFWYCHGNTPTSCWYSNTQPSFQHNNMQTFTLTLTQ